MSEQLILNLFQDRSERRTGETGSRSKGKKTVDKQAPDNTAATVGEEKSAVQLHSSERMILRRAVLRWLEAELSPQGMMVGVPTRNAKFKADIAAFWSKAVSNRGGSGPRRLFQPDQTMVVECFTTREQCRLSCSETDHILNELIRKRQFKQKLETEIRRAEPHLRCSEALFEDYADWDYARSRNPEYQQLIRDIRDLEEALQKGTRFERIQSADMADCLYAAVPAGLVEPHELGQDWGLLWVYDNLEVEVKKRAVERPVPESNRVHLIQNISAAGKNSFLAMQGLRHGNQEIYFVKQPRFHRKKQDVYYRSDGKKKDG